MIYMEVDLHSPPYRALRSLSSSKRARSPESPPNRPSKRLSLAVDHSRFAHAHSHSSGYATPRSSASSSRFPSEDWVHQTDGLTIDSPVVLGLGLTEDLDEDMNMDPVEPSPTSHIQEQHPIIIPKQSSIQPLPYAHAALYQHEPTPFAAAASLPLPPSYDAPRTRSSTPPAQSNGNGSSAMLVSSPEASFGPTGVTSPRKQRFTMGPRSDCIKCQLGVKGHSVHY